MLLDLESGELDVLALCFHTSFCFSMNILILCNQFMIVKYVFSNTIHTLPTNLENWVISELYEDASTKYIVLIFSVGIMFEK